MIISHKYKFIFIRTVKTAGTSIEVELSKILDKGDVITDIKPKVKDHSPKNTSYRGKKFYNHMSAREIKNIVSEKIFLEYFKFCIEREPVDKSISHYSMFKNSPYHKSEISNLNWEEYISLKKFPIDYEKYTDLNGNLLVDKIIKFENLDIDLKKTLNNLGVNFTKLNVFEKSGFREKIQVTYAQKKIIYDAFNSSNKYTGYQLNKS